ncbi:MAG: flagellar hook-associated protein FlgK [Alphaproteobacteria bacterium]
MSLSLTLLNGLSGLTASQGGLAVISQNVANANTVGYSRQVTTLEQQTIDGVGLGVQVTGVERVVDEFLIRELRSQHSALGEAVARDSFMQQIQARFGTPQGNNTVSAELGRFASALDTLANNPEDPALRFAVIAAATSLARNISDLATATQTLRGQTDKEILTSVDVINSQLRIADRLNDKIATAMLTGGQTADLKDKRDLAVAAIAEHVDISTFITPDGRMTIMTGRGQPLLDADLHQLSYTPVATVNSTTVFGSLTVSAVDSTTLNPVGVPVTLVSGGQSSAVVSNIDSGRLKGLLDVRDGTLNNLAAQIDTLATAVRDQFNSVHNSGVSFPAPNSLTGTRAVTIADPFQGTGTVRIAVTDGSGAIVGTPLDLDLTALGATTVGGLITAINAGLGADGTASLVNGLLQISATNAGNGIAINETGTQVTGTTRAFSHYFGLNDFFVGSGSTDFAVRPTIVADPRLVATAELSTTATTGQTGITIGDNRTIQNLSAVTGTSVSFSAVGGLLAGSFTLGDYAAAITGLNAAQASDAESRATIEQDLFDNLDHRNSSFSGVNVDEEMANMIVFQNAFAASARMMTTANELFDVLLNMV